MHPLACEQPYPKRQWWAIAYSSEVTRQILGRTILGERVIMYRKEAGGVAVHAGHCPHRSYPLEKSCLKGDAVQCGYHGFTFDSSGACVHVPSQERIPQKSSLRTYPAEERGGLVWVWTGEAAQADVSLIPDTDGVGLGEGWTIDVSPLVTIKGRYTLLIDNLLDLSHASFIHSDTIPGSEAIAALPVTITEDERSLKVERVGVNLPTNPFFKLMFPRYEGGLDQHFDAEYLGPCLIRTGGPIKASDTGKELGVLNFIHVITPETPHSVHYFVMTTRNFAQENEALSAHNLEMGDRIQPQDIDAIESIEAMFAVMETPPTEMSCKVDNGALKVRRRLERQIRSEAL